MSTHVPFDSVGARIDCRLHVLYYAVFVWLSLSSASRGADPFVELPVRVFYCTVSSFGQCLLVRIPLKPQVGDELE